jgi:sugar (pentulose or hexulose) kinase
MTLLGIDVGTTHCKAGLFASNGKALKIASRDNVSHRAVQGYAYYAADELWQAVADAVGEVTAWAGMHKGAIGPIRAVGIASMAESGLLVDRQSGATRTPIYPWFDQSAMNQGIALQRLPDSQGRFCRHGIEPTFKCSLARILWLRDTGATRLEGSTWLSAADYIAYRLTGELASDYSLAVRTYAFDLNTKSWDTDLLDALKLGGDVFPALAPAGTPVGNLTENGQQITGLPHGIPVAVAGHDHICGAFAAGMTAGGIAPNLIFDSLGTAESLLGVFPERPLVERDRLAGFSYGCHVAQGSMYWLGGLSTSGGSVEWLRGMLGEPPLSYDDLDNLLRERPIKPTGIVYFPYLAGSGSPHTEPLARGAFVGLSMAHSRADLYQAALEGVAYEIEFMRRKAQEAFQAPIRRIVAAGGGTRNRPWMQIRANISGCQVDALVESEATLQGAALLAGLGSGYYTSQEEIIRILEGGGMESYVPQPDFHLIYQELYEKGFESLQKQVRNANN